MRVIGYNHYKLSDGSGEFAGVVFDMIGFMNSGHKINDTSTNEGGWPSTSLRDYLNDIVFEALPQNWKVLIKEVEVMSTAGGTKTNIVKSNDKLSILNPTELGFTQYNCAPYTNEIDENAEMITFEIFTDNDSRFKKYINGTGSGSMYPTRSPYPNNSRHFCFVRNGGSGIYYEIDSTRTDFGISWFFNL